VRAFRRVNRASGRVAARFGISAEQAHILAVLWAEGPLKVGQLQAMLELSSATLTGAVDRMQQLGLVRRTADPRDRRAFMVEATGVATARRRAIETALVKMEAECFAPLGARGRRELLRLLGQVVEASE
jgi:DNA-binding MarR family transcriptional regulator